MTGVGNKRGGGVIDRVCDWRNYSQESIVPLRSFFPCLNFNFCEARGLARCRSVVSRQDGSS